MAVLSDIELYTADDGGVMWPGARDFRGRGDGLELHTTLGTMACMQTHCSPFPAPLMISEIVDGRSSSRWRFPHSHHHIDEYTSVLKT